MALRQLQRRQHAMAVDRARRRARADHRRRGRYPISEVFSTEWRCSCRLVVAEVELYGMPTAMIWLQGHKQGLYTLNFVSRTSGAVVFFMGVDVVQTRVDRSSAAFNDLPGVRKKFGVEQIAKKVRRHLGPQRQCHDRKSLGMFDEGLVQELDINDPEISLNNTEHLSALVDFSSHASADWHVYLGWGVEDSPAAIPLAAAPSSAPSGARRWNSWLRITHRSPASLGHLRICRAPPSHDTQTGDLILQKARDGTNSKIRRTPASGCGCWLRRRSRTLQPRRLAHGSEITAFLLEYPPSAGGRQYGAESAAARPAHIVAIVLKAFIDLGTAVAITHHRRAHPTASSAVRRRKPGLAIPGQDRPHPGRHYRPRDHIDEAGRIAAD